MATPPDTSLKKRIFDAFGSRPRPVRSQILRSAVGREGDRLRDLLAGKTPAELASGDLRTEVSGNLWMLAPGAFLYFLPGFVEAALESYASVSILVSELVGALTEPARTDITEALDRVAKIPPALGWPSEMTDILRKQQLEWFDSGASAAIFHERFDSLTHAEGAAILAFLEALWEGHGVDFPFGEPQIAIDRYWSRFRM